MNRTDKIYIRKALESNPELFNIKGIKVLISVLRVLRDMQRLLPDIDVSQHLIELARYSINDRVIIISPSSSYLPDLEKLAKSIQLTTLPELDYNPFRFEKPNEKFYHKFQKRPKWQR